MPRSTTPRAAAKTPRKTAATNTTASISAEEIARKAYELTLLLDLLLVSGIKTFGNSPQHRWVIVPDPAAQTNVNVTWAQEGYFIPEFATVARVLRALGLRLSVAA